MTAGEYIHKSLNNAKRITNRVPEVFFVPRELLAASGDDRRFDKPGYAVYYYYGNTVVRILPALEY